jgi:hypothetical protein
MKKKYVVLNHSANALINRVKAIILLENPHLKKVTDGDVITYSLNHVLSGESKIFLSKSLLKGGNVGK